MTVLFSPFQSEERAGMNGFQARLARMALRKKFSEAAALCAVAVGTIQRIEADDRTIKTVTTQKVRAAYEHAGIEFIDDGKGPGIRLVRPKAKGKSK